MRDKLSRRLCGSPYTEHCKNLKYAMPGDTFGEKTLDAYCVYCTAGEKAKKIKAMGKWTGLTPLWCPKLKKAGTEDERMDL